MRIGYKWTRMHDILVKENSINPHLPKTYLFYKSDLSYLLYRFRKLILKPSGGNGGGKGIFKLSLFKSLNGKTFELQRGAKSTKFRELSSIVEIIKAEELKQGTRFLIQEYIELATVKGSPFDIRVMMQKTNDSWMQIGRAARIAASGKFVTNYHQGGQIASVERAILASNIYDKSKIGAILYKLGDLSQEINSKVAHKFAKSTLSGLDFGLDKKGKLWFIESNPKPSLKLFKSTCDKFGISYLSLV